MSFPPQFLDEIRARQPLSEVVGRRVRLARRGREQVGLCPFHKEKTPSFTVSEDKGFFHCFGCGAHGDVIGFVMRLDNLDFLEAVERLARSAGLTLPRHSPEDKEKAKQRTSLYAVNEAACAWFEAQLAGPRGKVAREYLAARGVDGETIERFRLGWAPSGRAALKPALAGHGITETKMAASGLLVAPEDGGAPYDRFRGRIIFPITDRSGRVVAFGGRIVGDGKPKYLNSPESPLFHKGTLLYGLALAGKSARDAGEVIVAEGYMDVIALHRAGFENAVAPLGTALTETQLGELWRLAPEPILCFDGDDAGRRAGFHAAQRALPLLRPGLSLRFVALPADDDPESFLTQRGVQAFRDILAAARPLTDVLWEMEVGARPMDTPERRAGVQRRLDECSDRIGDGRVRQFYKDQFRRRLWHTLKSRKPPARRRERAGTRTFSWDRPPEPRLLDSLGSGSDGVSQRRERLMVTMIVNRPELLAAVGEEFAAIEIGNRDIDGLRTAILDIASSEPDLDSETLKRHLSARGLATTVDFLSAPQDWSERRLEDRFADPEAVLSDLEKGWRHVLALNRRVTAAKSNLEAAVKDLAEDMTEEAFERFKASTAEADAGNEVGDDQLDWKPRQENPV